MLAQGFYGVYRHFVPSRPHADLPDDVSAVALAEAEALAKSDTPTRRHVFPVATVWLSLNVLHNEESS